MTQSQWEKAKCYSRMLISLLTFMYCMYTTCPQQHLMSKEKVLLVITEWSKLPASLPEEVWPKDVYLSLSLWGVNHQ